MQSARNMAGRALRGTVGIAAAAALGVGAVAPALAAPAESVEAGAAESAGPTEHTDMGVTGADAMAHLQELSDISLANADDGYRALDTEGYEQASQYVEQTLEATGAYEVERDYFDVQTQEFGEVGFAVGETAYEVEPFAYTEATDGLLSDAVLALPADDGVARKL